MQILFCEDVLNIVIIDILDLRIAEITGKVIVSIVKQVVAPIDIHEDRQSRRIIHRADDFKSIGLVGVFIIKLQLLTLLDTRLVCKCRRHQDPVFIRLFQIRFCIVNIR